MVGNLLVASDSGRVLLKVGVEISSILETGVCGTAAREVMSKGVEQ